MNAIASKFLLAGDKFEMHLKQSGFTYSACGPFTKKRKNKKLKDIGHSRYIYQNKLGKAFF